MTRTMSRGWNMLCVAGTTVGLVLTTILFVSAQPGPFRIVPGQRVGPIELGMSIDDAAGILGNPGPSVPDCDPQKIRCYYSWAVVDMTTGELLPTSHGIAINTIRGIIVRIVVIDDPRYISLKRFT